MDDSCAVCADALEWVAYGPCGHRDVCSTCVARLRVICNDRRCCICKSECPIVFVTKALGDYSRTIRDFSVFPSEPKEGRVGSYWYNDDAEAFFDDSDHYKMIKAMCRLSCSVCDKMEEETNNGPKRWARFKNIEQLKGHLFHRHRLIMCSLCLEGRKVFISEQKLYTRAQLNQHISTGDSEVDGDERERAGFTGHPLCEFCKSPFYGDNELYSHMSTEHYTCHICQRQHPGQYEYYKNYDDLEIHFRREHFLCEDEACLAKKFVVFQSEAEMKRHNTLEHGGRMSRAKRNAALLIPTSFRYRRNNDQDHRHGRGRTFHHGQSDDQLSIAIQESLETAHSEGTSGDQPFSSMHVLPDLGDTDVDSIVQPIETLAVTDSEASSRYLQALGHSRNAPLQESLFPPLPLAPSGSQQKGKNESKSLPGNTMASHLRQQNIRNATIPNSGQAWPAAGRGNISSNSSEWPAVNLSSAMSRSSTENSPTAQSSSSQASNSTQWPAISSSSAMSKSSAGNSLTAQSSSSQASNSTQWPAINPSSAMSRSSAGNSLTAQPSSSQASNSTQWPAINPSSAVSRGSGGNSLTAQSSSSQARNRALVNHGHPSGSSGSSGKISHSISAPNLSESGSSTPSISDFPAVSAVQTRKVNPTSQLLPPVEDVHAANKSLVEKMRDALQNDEEKFAIFRDISGQYRQGSVDTDEYLYYVQQFGLSHLVMDLARLCPDPQKQRDLIEAYNASLTRNILQGNHQNNGSSIMKDKNKSRKGKGVAAENSVSNETLADKILSSVRALQSNHNPVEEVEVLSKDGYRSARGKSAMGIQEQAVEQSGQNDSSSISNVKDGGGGSKQKKKSKFHRIRLGDGSAAAYLDLRNSDPDTEPDPLENRVDNNQNAGLPVKGVWRKGGSSKLFP